VARTIHRLRQKHNKGTPDRIPPQGYNLIWCIWKTDNSIRSEIGRTKENMRKWGLITDEDCECGNVQTTRHLLKCPILPVRGEMMDFIGHQFKGQCN